MLKPNSLDIRLVVIGAVIVGAVLVALLIPLLPIGIDWHLTYRPVALGLLNGESPYANETFFNPPWVILPFIPLALLPEAAGRAVFFVISLVGMAIAGRRLGASAIGIVALLLSPPALHGLLNANIDWIPLLGATLPTQWGLLLVLVKPQVGAFVALYWLYDSWRIGGIRRVISDFMPVTVVLIISFVLFGFFPAAMLRTPTMTWNASLFPYTIPLGLALLVAAFRQRKTRFALATAPCLSPYLALHSWIAGLGALAPQTPELIAAVVGFWCIVLFQAGVMGF